MAAVPQPSPPWKDVEAELCTEDAARLRRDVEAELEDPDFIRKVTLAMASDGAVQYQGVGLFMLGPSAAGKSYALCHGNVEVPMGAYTLDGARIREASVTWARALELASSRGLAGFSNLFTDYFKPPMDKVKAQIVDDVIDKRANLIIPDTASNFASTARMIDQLLDKGYQLRFVAVFANRDTCEARGIRRESEEGKRFSSKNWHASMQAIFQTQAHLRSKGILEATGGIRVFSNMGELYSTSLQSVEGALARDSQRGMDQPTIAWCEARLLAGVYQKSGDEELIEVVPESCKDDTVLVTMTTIRNGNMLEAKTLAFDVASCTLGAPGASAVEWQLMVTPPGRAALRYTAGGSSLGDVFLRVALIAGQSMELPVDKEAMFVTELLAQPSGRLRALTENEYKEAAQAAQLFGPRAAPRREEPKALFVVAPSGGGKTTVLRTHASKFNITLDEAVLVDGAFFRDFHAQYKYLLDNGKANNAIWFRAWPAVKEAVVAAKKKMLEAACMEQQDLVISDTGSDTSKLVQAIERMKARGYTVSICGIFADPLEIVARGVARELDSGKRYNRDVGKCMHAFDSFAPAVQAANGTFCFVRNSQGRSPELYRDGTGGLQLAFSLHDALVWRGPAAEGEPTWKSGAPLEVCAKPEDVTYIMEGNTTIVCAVATPGSEAIALRFRKGDNSTSRSACEFVKGVGLAVMGSEYAEPSLLVALTTENISAIDEALLPVRPAKRLHKRLDLQLRDSCGRVLATQVPNLMVSPVASFKAVTVELKPKCGLVERQGLPCRYTLLQHYKLAAGQIRKLSSYDPVKLLSKQPALVSEALSAALCEPQNNIRIFIDGSAVFSEELLDASVESSSAVRSHLDAALQEVGLHGTEGLLSLVSGLLCSPTVVLPERLRRLQALAAGETEHIALQLYELLHRHVGDKTAADLLSAVENFELAAQGIHECPVGEAGIVFATKEMDRVLVQAETSSGWSSTTQQEVVRWLCRFLLGRVAHDVSMLINFVSVPAQALTPEHRESFTRNRFTPLDAGESKDTETNGGLWTRISVVDLNIKSAAKIPEYATQLDRCAQAYYQRFATSARSSTALGVGNDCIALPVRTNSTQAVDVHFPSPSPVSDAQASDISFAIQSPTYLERRRRSSEDNGEDQEAVGGHAESIIFEGEVVWKKDQDKVRGLTEFSFLRDALVDQTTAEFIPRLVGYRVRDGSNYLGMSNMLHGLSEPAIMDIKMGTRTYNTGASKDKIKQQTQKAAASTTSTLGVRVVGGRLKSPETAYERVGYKNKQEVKDEEELRALLARFFSTLPLRESAQARLRQIADWWEKQAKFAFYSSSLLMAYDTVRRDGCRINMIDFANCEHIKSKDEDLSGYRVGLETLDRVLSSL